MNQRFSTWVGLAAGALLLSACSGLLGLGDFKDATDGGVSGAGGSSSTGGTAGSSGTGGVAGAGGSNAGGAAGAGGSAGTGGSGGAPVVCDGGAVTNCGGKCVDISSDGANCGACGHDCGGGKCDKGVCQPVVVVDNLTKPVFDVDATQLYYGDSAGNTMLACPKGGCTLQPKQLASVGAIDSPPEGIAMVSGAYFGFVADPASHVARPSLFVCPISGCPASPTYAFYGGLNPPTGSYAVSGQDWYWALDWSIYHENCGSTPCADSASDVIFNFGNSIGTVALSADDKRIYFVSPSGTSATTPDALESCPKTGACTPSVLYSSASGVTATTVFGNKVYMLNPGGQGGYPDGTIQTCPTTGSCKPTTFANSQPHPTLMTVDASGVYWFDYDPPANGVAGQIVTCPLSGCVGGPRVLASKQTGTAVLHTDDKFVYWATATQILRVAK